MGIGKNVMGTVPLRGIRKKYPADKYHLSVVASHPEVFRGNPNVDRIWGAGATPNFWDLYKGATILKSEPYYDSDYLAKKVHLTEAWCRQLDVPFDNTRPDIVLNRKEIAKGLDYIRSKGRPVLVMQFQGGAQPQQVGQPQQGQQPIFNCPKMFIRNLDMNVAKNVSEAIGDKYFTTALQYQNQAIWQGPELLQAPLRDIFSVIYSANKILCIDSFVMHVATALGKKPVVCWAGTSPKSLGYPQNTNLTMDCCDDPECGRPNSFLLDVDFKGEPWDCPHGEPCTYHDEQDVIDALVKKERRSAKSGKSSVKKTPAKKSCGDSCSKK
jgi:hypothetical protein